MDPQKEVAAAGLPRPDIDTWTQNSRARTHFKTLCLIKETRPHFAHRAEIQSGRSITKSTPTL